MKWFFFAMTLYLPFLVSFEPDSASKMKLYYSYTSPEGIEFLSYDPHWDEDKLRSLYHLLLLNKHGKEFNTLHAVEVKPGNEEINGDEAEASYTPSTKTITLDEADQKHFPSEYIADLAHEYGHHFAYYYLPEEENESDTWVKKRGLTSYPVRWQGSKLPHDHAWMPEEILAEDYSYLYGVKRPYDLSEMENINHQMYEDFPPFLHWYDFYDAHYIENQSIPNPSTMPEYQHYLEKISGVKIDNDRKVKMPVLSSVSYKPYVEHYGDAVFTYKTDTKNNFLYLAEIVWADPAFKNKYGHLLITLKQHNGKLVIDPSQYEGLEQFDFGQLEFCQGTILLQLRVVNTDTEEAFALRPVTVQTKENKMMPASFQKTWSLLSKSDKSDFLKEYVKGKWN